MVGTVITKASVERRSIEAASDSTALYRAAKSTTAVASGKLQHTSASRANGLAPCKRCCRENRTADCTVTRARVPTDTAGEKANWMSRQDETYRKNRYLGSGRANQFETAGYHDWQVNVQKDNRPKTGVAEVASMSA